MSVDCEPGQAAAGAATATRTRDGLLLAVWGRSFGLLGLTWMATLLLKAPVVESLVATWLRSSSFTHCLLIMPMSLWLAWGVRHRLLALSPAPAPITGLAAVSALTLLGALGTVAAVALLEQYALAATLIALAVALLGHRAAWRLGFPLGFLLLAVPVGSSLLQPMMDFTTAFTVAGLRLTGVPVYVQGNLIEIPTGSWRVVEACSGVRYVTASFTLGTVYAWMTYRSPLRRALFVLASVLVPIVANGVRAYSIILTGHLNGMETATLIDHVTYGWLFFGVVTLLLFGLGGLWRETQPAPPEGPQSQPAPAPPAAAHGQLGLAGLLLGVVLAGTLPGQWQEARRHPDAARADALPRLPARLAGWTRTLAEPDWQPAGGTAARVETVAWSDGASTVWARLDCYSDAAAGAEPASSTNALLDPDDMSWIRLVTGQQDRPGQEPGAVNTLLVRRGDVAYRAWQWWWVPGLQTASVLRVKFSELLARLRGGPAPGCRVTIWTPQPADGTPAPFTPPLESLASRLAAHLAALPPTER